MTARRGRLRHRESSDSENAEAARNPRARACLFEVRDFVASLRETFAAVCANGIRTPPRPVELTCGDEMLTELVGIYIVDENTKVLNILCVCLK